MPITAGNFAFPASIELCLVRPCHLTYYLSSILFLFRYFYVGLGDVSSGATQTPFLALIHLTFVILNTLLMLNLLIAMMVRPLSSLSEKVYGISRAANCYLVHRVIHIVPTVPTKAVPCGGCYTPT
jgi:hypothetical protein